jgi:hypothetical protein
VAQRTISTIATARNGDLVYCFDRLMQSGPYVLCVVSREFRGDGALLY